MTINPAVTFFEVTPIWRGSVDRNALIEALLATGISEDNLPRDPNVSECLHRAMKKISPRGALVRQFPAAKDDVGCLGGVSLAYEDRERLDLTRYGANEAHQTSLTVKAYQDPGVDGIRLHMEPAFHPLCSLVESEFSVQQKQYVMNADVSLWFTTQILPACGAIRKRPNGGVYYVPAVRSAILTQVRQALDAVSSFRIYGKSPVTGEEMRTVDKGGILFMEPRTSSEAATLHLVLDGIVNDVDTALTDVADRLQKGLGIRALRTQKGDVEDLERKLHTFESILGAGLPLLQQKIAEAQAAIGYAIANEEAQKEQKNRSDLLSL